MPESSVASPSARECAFFGCSAPSPCPDHEMSQEARRALEIGPPDFLLGEDFDAENGAGASDELRRLAEENSRD